MLCMGSYRRRRRAEIVLDYNRLTSVPAKLLQLPALKKLSLQHNFITQLDAESVAACGAKLSSVQLDGNPLAYPPTAIALKGWSTVKKWMPANPSFVTYRMYVPAVPPCQFEMTCARTASRRMRVILCGTSTSTTAPCVTLWFRRKMRIATPPTSCQSVQRKPCGSCE